MQDRAEFIQDVSYCYYTSWALALVLAVTQEREILMSSRQEYQSEQAGRQADEGGQGPEDTRTIQHTDHHLLLLCLARDDTNRNTKSPSFPPFLHDIIVSVIENGILRGYVCPHVVGKG